MSPQICGRKRRKAKRTGQHKEDLQKRGARGQESTGGVTDRLLASMRPPSVRAPWPPASRASAPDFKKSLASQFSGKASFARSGHFSRF